MEGPDETRSALPRVCITATAGPAGGEERHTVGLTAGGLERMRDPNVSGQRVGR